MQVAAITHNGLVRKNNEDAYFFNESLGVFGVADGMGGHEAGEVASNLAINVLAEGVTVATTDDPLENLKEIFYQANHLVFTTGKEQDKKGMGTTMTAAIVRNNKLYLAHVGDSRAYLLHQGSLQQITTDHSLVGELLKEGKITADEAFSHPQKNIITRCLGQSNVVAVDGLEGSFQQGDRLLLTTDGFHNYFTLNELLKYISTNDTAENILNRLLQIALNKGGHDNITAVFAIND